MIFTTCCDSSRRLYDILRDQFPDRFFFCLDLPRKINDFAVTLYTRQLQKLIDAMRIFRETFSEQKLLEICKKRMTEQKTTSMADPSTASQTGGLRIALAGARPGSEIRQLITDHQQKSFWI